jgi:AraC family transcriptional regulator
VRERPNGAGESVADTAGALTASRLSLPQGAASVLEPAGTPLAAVESVRTERIHRAVFGHAKIVHVLERCARIETATGTHEFPAGTAMALGAGRWCTVQPESSVRMWTVFLDEAFLRAHMRWVLWDVRRALPGTHPDA